MISIYLYMYIQCDNVRNASYVFKGQYLNCPNSEILFRRWLLFQHCWARSRCGAEKPRGPGDLMSSPTWAFHGELTKILGGPLGACVHVHSPAPAISTSYIDRLEEHHRVRISQDMQLSASTYRGIYVANLG